jgi:hypothetical protein
MNDQPKLAINRYGDKFWKLNGEYHREDGPAIEHMNGYKAWYLNGLYHRIDGPAIEYSNGFKRWYLDNIDYTYEEWFQKLTLEQQYNYLWNLDEQK